MREKGLIDPVGQKSFQEILINFLPSLRVPSLPGWFINNGEGSKPG